MSDEITPNIATFDVAEMFAGKSYPKDTVEVFMDEATAYEINKLQAEARQAVASQDEEAGRAVEERLTALVKRGAASKYVFHLTGVSRDSRKAAVESVTAEFPMEQDFLGRDKPNPQGDEKYANLMWALHIEKIVAPSGAVIVAPSEADIKVIRGNAPDPAVEKVEAAIKELSTGVKSGFETLAQEHDFLS